ncbi:MAG TPA: zinc-binding dehydrogenase [Thermohalobaculum sp.]|nr:zinc-binding dehydrogenase [Thermohalobaculum sp.]
MNAGLPEVMRGWQLTGHGGPEALVWNEAIPVPRPGPGEVLTRVLAAGVNNTDINTRLGWYAREVRGGTGDAAEAPPEGGRGWSGGLTFPRIQGADLCGEVVAVGPDADPFVPGMRVTCPTNQPEPTAEAPTGLRVIGSEYDGAFAEYCLVPARHLYDVSASPLPDIEIGAMPCAFGTAEGMLTRAGVGEGDRVLVTGASGGVGLAAVQLARRRGAEVTGVTSAAKAGAVRDAGAAAVLDRGAVPPEDAFTVVIDLVAGPGWGALIDALRPGGRYATAGAIAGPIVEADLRTIYLHDLTLYGCTYQPAEVFAGLVAAINDGSVRPLVSQTYPLAELPAAQEAFQAKRHPGKLVLIPEDAHG